MEREYGFSLLAYFPSQREPTHQVASGLRHTRAPKKKATFQAIRALNVFALLLRTESPRSYKRIPNIHVIHVLILTLLRPPFAP